MKKLLRKYWFDYGKSLVDMGAPPSEFVARRLYDMEHDRLLDRAAWQAVHQERRRRFFRRLWRGEFVKWPS